MEKIKGKIKAIIFDMDGTIINTEKLWQKVTLDVLNKHGVTTFTPAEQDILLSLSGMHIFHSSPIIKETFGLNSTTEELIQQTIDFANQSVESHIDFIDGFETFHQKLQAAAIPTGIATNAHPSNLQELIKKMNFERYFGQNIYSMANVNNKPKPDPALFLHTAEQLGAQPHECIVFEDSIYGFQAAKAAGMRCIAIANDLNKHLTDHVHEVIKNYHEAEEALVKLSDKEIMLKK